MSREQEKAQNFSVKLTSSKKCKIVRETGCAALGTILDYRLWHAKLTKFMNWQIFFPKWRIFSESYGIYLLNLAVLLCSYLSFLIFEKGVSCFGTRLLESIHLTWSINRSVGSNYFLFHVLEIFIREVIFRSFWKSVYKSLFLSRFFKFYHYIVYVFACEHLRSRHVNQFGIRFV